MEPVTEHTPPRTPRGLKAEGRKLWDAVSTEYDLEAHNIPLLEMACRSADKVKALEREIEQHGYTINSPQGLRANPALAEQRAHIKQVASILATLRLPGLEDEDDKPKTRATRGAYRQRGY